MRIRLHIVSGSFHAAPAEPSGCERHHMAHEPQHIYYLALYTKFTSLHENDTGPNTPTWLTQKRGQAPPPFVQDILTFKNLGDLQPL